MDKAEWDNVGKFLRTAYTSADTDMKMVAGGIKNPENKERALNDIEQLKKYTQAGDVPVSKQDAKGFLAVSSKLLDLVNDFFNALVDIPSEL